MVPTGTVRKLEDHGMKRKIGPCGCGVRTGTLPLIATNGPIGGYGEWGERQGCWRSR